MCSFSDRFHTLDTLQWHNQKTHLTEAEDCGSSSVSHVRSNMNDSDEGHELKEVQIESPEPRTHRRANGKTRKISRVLSTRNIKKRRLVGKSGGLKVVASQVPQKHGMYFSDLFTTMIDSKWRWITFIYTTMYCGSWASFGLIWWLITYVRGDNVCVENVYSFTSAFLFSLETQTTIGYGGRQITPACPEAVVLLNIQSLVGFMIGALVLGLIFAKLSRPRNRAETILFSRNAVVSLRDGKMCLMFRVGDVRKSQILEAHVRVYLFRKRLTREGIELPFYQQNLPVGIDWSCVPEENLHDTTLFLILPLTIVHIMDENSPLYDIQPKDLLHSDFEIVVVLEGTVEATSMLTQAKTSYIADEILWGHEFVSTMDESCWKKGRYRVDFSAFDDTYPFPTPMVSARDYYEGKMFNTNSLMSLGSEETLEDDEKDSDNTTATLNAIQAYDNNLSLHVNGDTIAYV